MDLNKTGKYLKKLREENNLTQKDVAYQLNISVQAVSKWETGKSFPQWSGHCRTDSLYLRFCIIAVILGLLDLVSVRLSLYRGNTTPS